MSEKLCPNCSSSNLVKFGFKRVGDAKITGHKKKVQQYQCKDCGLITTKVEDADSA